MTAESPKAWTSPHVHCQTLKSISSSSSIHASSAFFCLSGRMRCPRAWQALRGRALHDGVGGSGHGGVARSTSFLLRTAPGQHQRLHAGYVTLSCRNHGIERAHQRRTVRAQRTLCQIQPHIATRQCSSEASSGLVKMASDRDVLSGEYVCHISSAYGSQLTAPTASSPPTTPSPSPTSNPTNPGPTRAPSTLPSRSRRPSSPSPSTLTSSRSTRPASPSRAASRPRPSKPRTSPTTPRTNDAPSPSTRTSPRRPRPC